MKEMEDTTKNSKNFLNEKVRFRKETSGLPMIIWVTPDDGTNNGPKLRFQDNTNDRFNPRDMVPISIHPSEPTILRRNYQTNLPSEDIAKLKQWIIQNYKALLQYWNGEIWEGGLVHGVTPYVEPCDK